MKIGIVSIFPEMFEAVTEYGVSARAVSRNLVDVELYNPRDFTEDRHQTVDDRPYGGGPGMLMQPEPLQKAIEAAKLSLTGASPSSHAETAIKECPVIYLSPQGKRIDQATIQRLAELDHFILLAGRYEGVDERLIEQQVDEELSLGDFVLSGGEIAAMAVLDAVTRLLPGALGHEDSASQDSFSDGLLDCPHYTRPEIYRGSKVPDVLLSGNHAAIAKWRLQQSLGRTYLRRPDLLEDKELSEQHQKLLEDFIEALNQSSSGG